PMGQMQAAMGDIAALSPEVRRNTAEREEAIADILQSRLAGTAAGAALARMSPGERANFLRVSAGRFWGRANEAILNSGYRGYRSAENALSANDPTTLGLADQQQQGAAFEGRLQQPLSPLGRASPMRRFFDALQNARPGTDLGQIAGATLGVRTDAINSAVSQPMQQ